MNKSLSYIYIYIYIYNQLMSFTINNEKKIFIKLVGKILQNLVMNLTKDIFKYDLILKHILYLTVVKIFLLNSSILSYFIP